MSARSEQALLILLPLASCLIPFASTLMMRGRRSFAAVSLFWLGVIAFCARPIFDHPPGPRCGLGELAALILAALVAAGFLVGSVGRVLLHRKGVSGGAMKLSSCF